MNFFIELLDSIKRNDFTNFKELFKNEKAEECINMKYLDKIPIIIIYLNNHSLII
jgi:hypothetical protein